MTTTSRSRRAVAALATLAALSAAGCRGSEEPTPDADPTSSTALVEPSAAPTLGVEPVTTSGSIVGRLPKKDRSRVERAVSARAVRFLAAAYLAGEYPRADFRDAYPGFTGGAAKVARADRALLTNQPIGQRIATVTPTRIRVKVDLLAVDHRAVAATAHIALGFSAEGRIFRQVRVQGRLLLTKQDGAWKIFGYDLSKGAR